MNKYRKRPLVIEAVQYTPDKLPTLNHDLLEWGLEAWHFGHYNLGAEHHEIVIRTLEGDMTVNIGDYIIKGIKGEFYPCKADIFEATYETVE
ncbi:MAG: hypothetical protein ABIP54_02085 [Candidatus Andersenbacteria bacterium]